MKVFKKIKKENGKRKIYLFGIKVFSYQKNIRIFFPLKKYANWLYDLKNNNQYFVPFTSELYQRKADDTKVFAYYLPQFHSIPENDESYGKGFTEWTNVASCPAIFVGHYQPKLPYDVGFYNLENVEVMRRQVEIAKAYGLYGFCFYYYWFSGKKVLEKPLYNFLHSDINFYFHFCWANENWNKLWDGGDKQVILEQKLQDGDAEKFFDDILPFIKDKRYERINNKPLLMIYRPTRFDKQDIKNFLEKLNKLAKKNGFEGFCFMSANYGGFNAPKEYGFDGIIEFPPHGITGKCEPIEKRYINTANFKVLSVNKFIKEKKYLYKADYDVFKCCFPSWDNSPRKAYSKGYCFEISSEQYKTWLSDILKWTKENHPKNKQYVYINAWNEWAEGACLEPNTRYGYQSLDILKECLEENYAK